jgi:hypothetical protein
MFISLLVLGKAVEKSEEENLNTQLSKPTAKGPDIGYALMNKGELLNCFMNFGQISDSYLQTEWYDFMWPKSKGAIASDDNASDDFSLLFAYKGNVIDGHTDNNDEDWGPIVGSLGRYHANDQADELKFQGFPHLAVSDIPATWPQGYDDENGNFISTPGERHWPGTFRIDIDTSSATYGQEVQGEFAADRSIYCALDDHDNLQNDPIGIRLDIQTYEYGRPYAADFHFYDVTITNISNTFLDSCWWGYYSDFDYGEYEDEVYYTYSSGLNPGPWDVMYTLDPVIDDASEFETGIFGAAFLITPKDMGITDSHYFLDDKAFSDEELWPIITSNPNDPIMVPQRADYFHGSNVRLDDYTLTHSMADPIGYDWTTVVASGPFDLAPGESVKSVIVVACGDDEADFKANIEMAKDMMAKYYQGPSAPKGPKLYAVPGDEQVTLYWTTEPEKTPDPFSGELDFEGYKIYRSTDNGQSWGEEITNAYGGLIGNVPVAQFDLDNSVSNLDPLNANFNLGTNSGIKYSWVDTDVENGVEYSYTITAYDRGDPEKDPPIQAFESSKGANEIEDNFVKVTPTPPALGYIDPGSPYEHISGHGKGFLDIEIIDPSAITDHVYQITFIDSPALNFNVEDVDSGITLLSEYPINTINMDDMPVLDGFRVRVNADEIFGGINSIQDEYGLDVNGSDKSDSTGSWYVDILSWPRGNFDALISDYEIRFTAQGSNVGIRIGTSIDITETVPFEVWNITIDQQVTAIVVDDGDTTYNEGEEIYLVNVPYTNPNIGDTYTLDIINDVGYKISIENAAADSINPQPPMQGQKVAIKTNRAHVPSDVYQISFTESSFKLVTKTELEEIRVVPNPYVVNAAWEIAKNVRRLQFMFLPPECTISIYTIRGELVTKLVHNDGSGSLDWNLTSDSNQDLAFGVYIYIVKTPSGEEHMGKFALIK